MQAVSMVSRFYHSRYGFDSSHRMLVFLAAVLTALALSGASCGQPSAGEQPNVVLIMTDDQGYGDVGAHGNEVIETPHLDRLYRESVRLTDFHVDPTCSPTRAALLTGRYSTKTGVWHTIAGRSQLSRDEVTVAEMLAEVGYRTGIFGKWHLGDNYPFRPQDHGFQEVLVHGGGGIGQTPDVWGNDYFGDTYWRNGEPETFEGYCTTVFFDEALRFIEGHRDDPFFAFISTNVAHSPRHVPEAYAQAYMDRGISEPLAKFYGMLTHFDEQLGRLREQLDRWGLAENTILIFTTDNGTAGSGYNAGMRGRKGSEYEGGHRVPFYVHWPNGDVMGGRDVEKLTAHIDVVPTLLELTGAEPSRDLALDGRSLVPLLKGQASGANRTLFVHSQRIQRPEKWRNSAVMTERWRLINGEELYDLSVDPGQERDVSSDHPEIVDALREEYDDWWRELSSHVEAYPRIVLGTEHERPSRLTAHDWHNPASQVPWNQSQIREDPELNGFWAVEMAEAGAYEIELRQRPRGVEHPIDGSTARVRVGNVERSKEIPPGASAVTFRGRLEAGPARLQTWFMDGDSPLRGAYYVYVRRIAGSR